MATKKKSTAPSGLKITRNNNKIICEWTTHDYESQTFQINVNEAKYKSTKKGKHKKGDLIWTSIPVGKAKHKKTITTGTDKYPNNKVIPRITTGFRFRVRGTSKKKKVSGFTKTNYKAAKMGVPTYVSPTLWNNTTDAYSYTWSQNSNDGDRASSKKMFSEFYWETVIMPKEKKPDWSLAKTQKITIVNPSTSVPSANQNSYGTSTATTPNIIIVESNADITANKVRYFRIQTRARHKDYHSKFRTHTKPLGAPNAVNLTNESASFGATGSSGTTASINFNKTDASEIKNMDNVVTEIQYAITQPYVTKTTSNNWVRSELSLPNGFNNWTTDLNSKFVGTGLPDTYVFRTTDQVIDNTVLFLRVVKTHDSRISYGDPVLLSRGSSNYSLSDPSLLSVNADPVTKEVQVTVRNNSELASGGNNSFIAVYCRSDSAPNPEKPIGIIPYSSSETSASFQASWTDSEAASVSIGIRAFVADYTPTQQVPSGVTEYTVSNIKMESSGIIWEDNAVPLPPQNVKVIKHKVGVALVTWDWNWSEANSAEISWSDDEITWESTTEPSTYTLSNTRIGKRYITGLDATTYYVRVRFIKTTNEVVTYGTYSDIIPITMSSAPNIPVLQLVPDDVVGINDDISAYWSYDSTDGTAQSYAEITEAFENNGSWFYADSSTWIKVNSEKATFTPKQMGWSEGTQHYICVRVTSASLNTSEGWSNPKSINVAEKPTISVSGIGGSGNPLRPETVTLDDGSTYTYPLVLKQLPLTCTVTGADSGGYVTATIERAANFAIDRADDSIDQGYEGETIFSEEFSTDSISIAANDLIGSLDDTATYKLLLSVTDSYGQTVSADPYEFTVMWSRQAEKPTATIVIDTDRDIAFITPIAPNGATSDDKCEIYRLSADRPTLVKANAEFGETDRKSVV